MSANVPLQRDADAVQAAVEEVFAREEFHTEPTLIERFLDWLGDLFFSEASDAAALARALAWGVGLLLALLAVVVIVFVVRSLREARTVQERQGADPEALARARAATLRHQARAARDAGDLRLALRLSFWALVVGLGARGDLTYRDAWTNRELLRRGRAPRALVTLLEPLVDELEAKDFGREPTRLEDVQRLEALCEEHLGPLARAEVAA